MGYTHQDGVHSSRQLAFARIILGALFVLMRASHIYQLPNDVREAVSSAFRDNAKSWVGLVPTILHRLLLSWGR